MTSSCEKTWWLHNTTTEEPTCRSNVLPGWTCVRHPCFRICSFMVFYQNQIFWPSVWTHTRNLTFMFLLVNWNSNRHTAGVLHKLMCFADLSFRCHDVLSVLFCKTKKACFSMEIILLNHTSQYTQYAQVINPKKKNEVIQFNILTVYERTFLNYFLSQIC